MSFECHNILKRNYILRMFQGNFILRRLSYPTKVIISYEGYHILRRLSYPTKVIIFYEGFKFKRCEKYEMLRKGMKCCGKVWNVAEKYEMVRKNIKCCEKVSHVLINLKNDLFHCCFLIAPLVYKAKDHNQASSLLFSNLIQQFLLSISTKYYLNSFYKSFTKKNLCVQ